MRQILIILIFFLAGCSATSRIEKFEGQPIQSVIQKMGQPTTIGFISGDSIYVYQSEKILRGTEISQGKTTLDPMISPSVTKSELIIFTVSGGKVTKAKKEIDYSKR